MKPTENGRGFLGAAYDDLASVFEERRCLESKNIRIHRIMGGKWYYLKGDRYLLVIDHGSGPELFTVHYEDRNRISLTGGRRWVARLAQRFQRNVPTQCLALGSSRYFLISGRNFVRFMDVGDERPVVETVGEMPVRPLVADVADDGRLFVGEYDRNPSRTSALVYESCDMGHRWEPVVRLNGVRHVHGVYYRSFDASLWVTTGDSDSESGIWRIDRDGNIDCVARGSQDYRAVQLHGTETGIYYGSDSPMRQNGVYRINPESGQITRLSEAPGPVYFGAPIGDGLMLTTAAEPSSPHSHDAYAFLAMDSPRRAYFRLPADRLPTRLFGYATLRTESVTDSTLLLRPYGTRLGNVSVWMSLNREDNE